MKRRDFLKASLGAGGALVLGIQFAGCASPQLAQMRAAARDEGLFRPNAVLTITPDDRVLVAVSHTEMGQGVFTSHAMLVAEELEVDLTRVKAFHPVAGPDYETFGLQMTGGSTSLASSYEPIRRAAATAREMLISAAAVVWQCPREECRAEQGAVVHSSGKRLTYGELTTEAARQNIPRKVTLKSPDQFQVIGTGARRVEGLEKLNGQAVYGIDVQVEGMVKAVVIRPPVMGSKVRSFEADEARAMPGVVDVFAFECGVAVVAEKYWQAQRASKHVVVSWDTGPLGGFDSQRMAEAARSRIDQPGLVIRDEGRVERALERTDVRVVDAVYEAPYLAHAPLEPMNATAHVTPGRCEIWAPVQWQSAVRSEIAYLLGMPKDDVHLHTTMLGGGFGRRLMLDYVVEAVLVARKVGRPVQVVWSREDDTRGGYYRPYSLTKLTGAVDGQGRAVALSYHNMSQSLLDLKDWLPGMLPGWLPRLSKVMMARAADQLMTTDSLPNVLATEGANDLSYAIDNVRVAYTQIRVDVPVTFWRAVGHSYNGFVMESFIDALTHAAGRDPYEFRRELLAEDPRKREVLDRVARLGRWGEPIESGWGRGIAVHRSFNTCCAQVIEAGLFDGEVKIRRVSCVVDCGVVVNPDIVVSQMESGIIQGLSMALMQKITFASGAVVEGNFDTYPMMRLHQCPEIVVELVESSEKPTGVGEPGLPPAPAALANALFAATGLRLRTMPFNDVMASAPARGDKR
jgi:isoquinoline 1-oxidoreductase subunit beta